MTGTNVRAITQIGAVLYSDFLQHNPKDPQWLNRDRFVLSGGHGWPFSDLFLYSSGSFSDLDIPCRLYVPVLLAPHVRL